MKRKDHWQNMKLEKEMQMKCSLNEHEIRSYFPIPTIFRRYRLQKMETFGGTLVKALK